MFETRPPGEQPASSQRVRFTFEAASARQAVDVAGRLRPAKGRGVRVRPARASGTSSFRWEIIVTTPVLETSGIADLEEEMRRIALKEPGIRFTGWLLLSGSP